MKKQILLIILIYISIFSYSQDLKLEQTKNLGTFYAYWGWNRGWFSNSDINFTGENYDFTLHNVVATDRPTPFDASIYFHPGLFTIPQYNFRLGYFIKENYTISFGIDHMKYVMANNQSVIINGEINNSGTIYDGIYNNDDFTIVEDFLKFEHTDGLNFANFEYRRFDNIIEYKKIKINITEGIGCGIIYPKTNATLLHNYRYDDYNLAGFGFVSVIGLNIKFYNKIFIQSEIKGGYINMPNIRTTNFTSDRAKQSFFFTQFNWLFGMTFKIS